jgi:hypothetical protein
VISNPGEEEKRALMSEKNKEIHKLRSIIEESRTMGKLDD